MSTSSSMINRMIRAAKLQSDLYEEVEADTGATGQAVLAVVLVSVIAGIGTAIGSIFVGGGLWIIWGLLAGIAEVGQAFGEAVVQHRGGGIEQPVDRRTLGDLEAGRLQQRQRQQANHQPVPHGFPRSYHPRTSIPRTGLSSIRPLVALVSCRDATQRGGQGKPEPGPIRVLLADFDRRRDLACGAGAFL